MKRAFDVTASLIGLILLSPLLLAAAVLVKLDSKGPVFFRQWRVGRQFRPFAIYKFRTMVMGSDRRGPAVTVRGDARVTRVGRALRWTKLDEMPQLWNVLRGDMSLVGPRPEVPRYVELFHDDYEEILQARPGITDLASVKYRDEAGLLAAAADPEREYVGRILPDKIVLAKEYVRQSSLPFDCRLILRTLLTILQIRRTP